MRPYYERRGVRIYHGDLREVLPALGEAFEACVTDPPYGLSFMGKGWDRGVPGPEFWRAVAGSLKPGALLFSFGGTRTWHRLACAIEDAGFEMRDCLMWLYGGGFPKSLDISKAIDKAAGAERTEGGREWNGGARQSGVMGKNLGTTQRTIYDAPATDAAKQWAGWGTALKPAWEPIILAMRPLDGTFVENAMKWGVAGLNVDACRVEGRERTEYGLSEAKRTRGSAYGKPTESADFDSGKGRWPANLILDKQSGAMLDAQTEGTLHGAGRAIKRGKLKHKGKMADDGGIYGQGLGESAFRFGDSGGASRFFYCAKASPSDRGTREYAALPLFGVDATTDKNDHPTVKPLDLMRWILKLASSPVGGAVVDPFMGSGTTLIAARTAGRPAVGVELEEEYCEIAARRLEQPEEPPA
jgi:site-specific DNA-methyltransferase (adenine-specific)